MLVAGQGRDSTPTKLEFFRGREPGKAKKARRFSPLDGPWSLMGAWCAAFGASGAWCMHQVPGGTDGRTLERPVDVANLLVAPDLQPQQIVSFAGSRVTLPGSTAGASTSAAGADGGATSCSKLAIDVANSTCGKGDAP